MSEIFEDKGYGALTGADSIRIYDYAQLPKKKLGLVSEDIKDYKIPEDRMPRVLDQGSISSCVGHACCSALEVIYYVKTGEWLKLSPGYIYGHHRKPNSTGRGMFTGTTVEFLKQWGSTPETMFKEHTEMPEMKKLTNARPELEEYAIPTKIGAFVKFNTADMNRRWNEIKEAFLTYGLPMIADSDKYFSEGHCFLVYGFNENGKHGKEMYFQNSWGEKYGNGGRSTIPFEDVDGLYLVLPEEISLQFDDVPESAWYYKNILHMYQSGLVNGKENNKFEPEAPITRAEICAIIDRLCEKIDHKDDAMIKSIYDYIDRKHKK